MSSLWGACEGREGGSQFWRIHEPSFEIHLCSVEPVCVGGSIPESYGLDCHEGGYYICKAGNTKDAFRLCKSCEMTAANVSSPSVSSSASSQHFHCLLPHQEVPRANKLGQQAPRRETQELRKYSRNLQAGCDRHSSLEQKPLPIRCRRCFFGEAFNYGHTRCSA